jgi:hypothetical protein
MMEENFEMNKNLLEKLEEQLETDKGLSPNVENKGIGEECPAPVSTSSVSDEGAGHMRTQTSAAISSSPQLTSASSLPQTSSIISSQSSY